VYYKFLETVVAISRLGKEFSTVQSFMDRILVLADISDSLKKRTSTAEDETDKLKSDLNAFSESIQKSLIKSQVILPLLQRQAGEAAAITANKRRKLENILETKIDKRYVNGYFGLLPHLVKVENH